MAALLLDLEGKMAALKGGNNRMRRDLQAANVKRQVSKKSLGVKMDLDMRNLMSSRRSWKRKGWMWQK